MIKLVTDASFDKRDFYEDFILRKRHESNRNYWTDILAGESISEIKMYCKNLGIEPEDISVMEQSEDKEYYIGKVNPVEARGLLKGSPVFLNVNFEDLTFELPEIEISEFVHRNRITNITTRFNTKDHEEQEAILFNIEHADTVSKENILIFNEKSNTIYCCGIYRSIHNKDNLEVVFDVYNGWKNIVINRAMI